MSRLYEKGQKTTFWKHNKRKNHYLCINQKWLVLFSCLEKSGLFLCPFLRKEVSTVANRIMGITVEIGGDTTKLQTALKGVNGQIKST